MLWRIEVGDALGAWEWEHGSFQKTSTAGIEGVLL